MIRKSAKCWRWEKISIWIVMILGCQGGPPKRLLNGRGATLAQGVLGVGMGDLSCKDVASILHRLGIVRISWFYQQTSGFYQQKSDLTSKNQDLASKDQDLTRRISVFSAKRLDGTINLKNFLYRDLMPDLFITAIQLVDLWHLRGASHHWQSRWQTVRYCFYI